MNEKRDGLSRRGRRSVFMIDNMNRKKNVLRSILIFFLPLFSRLFLIAFLLPVHPNTKHNGEQGDGDRPSYVKNGDRTKSRGMKRRYRWVDEYVEMIGKTVRLVISPITLNRDGNVRSTVVVR